MTATTPPVQPATPAERFGLRETVGYMVFRAVDIGDNRRDAALKVADEILREVARATDPEGAS